MTSVPAVRGFVHRYGLRLTIGAPGVALIAYGAYRIMQNSAQTNPQGLGRWLIGAIVVHDGILVPATMLIGFLLTRLVRPRARRYVQGGLVAAALVMVVAIPLIYRRGSQPAVKSLERQNYGLHLAVLVGLIVGVAAVAYLLRVHRDRSGSPTYAANEQNVRPSADQVTDDPKPASEA